jgi:hypothetical protein
MPSHCPLSRTLTLSTVLRRFLIVDISSQAANFRTVALFQPQTSSYRLTQDKKCRVRYSRRLFTSTPISSLSSSRQEAGKLDPVATDEPAGINSLFSELASDTKHSWKADNAPLAAEKASKGREPTQISSKKSKGKQEEASSKISQPKKKTRKPEPWQTQKHALKGKFNEGWNPHKKLSPDALDGIRHLHSTDPEKFTTPVLAEHFKVSPEAIRRILKSKWQPSAKEMEGRRKRWQKRHDRIWSQMAELGLRPKTKRTDAVSDVRILEED